MARAASRSWFQRANHLSLPAAASFRSSKRTAPGSALYFAQPPLPKREKLTKRPPPGAQRSPSSRNVPKSMCARRSLSLCVCVYVRVLASLFCRKEHLSLSLSYSFSKKTRTFQHIFSLLPVLLHITFCNAMNEWFNIDSIYMFSKLVGYIKFDWLINTWLGTYRTYSFIYIN